MTVTKKPISSNSASKKPSAAKKVDVSVEKKKELTSSDSAGFLGKGETDIQKQEPKNLIVDRRAIPDSGLPTEHVQGVLDIANEGSGLLRPRFAASDKDVYISASQIRRFNLRVGDLISGQARRPKENERFWGLLKVEEVNGNPIEKVADRANFEELLAV